MSKAKLQIYMPQGFKDRLEGMSEETGISQNQLILLAGYSLLANYDKSGSFIFADLLNPEHRQEKRT